MACTLIRFGSGGRGVGLLLRRFVFWGDIGGLLVSLSEGNEATFNVISDVTHTCWKSKTYKREK